YINVTGGFISSHTGKDAINITGSNFTIIRNVTINGSKTCINISANSENTSFFYNELYNCSVYVRSWNAKNYFNTSVNGVGQGNYYQNIRGVAIYDSDGDNYGDTGIGYPYNASTAGGNWTGFGADYGPIGAGSDSSIPTWSQTPENITLQYGSALNYTVNASDNDAIDSYSVNDTANFTMNRSTGQLENSTLLALQVYYISLSVNDSSGNNLSANITVNVTSALGPNITLLWPENNSVNYSSASAQFIFLANEIGALEVDVCSLIVNGTTYNTSIDAAKGVNATVWNNLPNGNYFWNITCNNTLGLENTSSASIFSINISGGQAPIMGNLSCAGANGIYRNCTTFTYGETIAGINASCSDE
ncbi:hypothetical protein COV61_04085, partial [Candidatus Micrarchaeota archaeon CG11_big_fil_rev_8_21_14_0_20_47_5]